MAMNHNTTSSRTAWLRSTANRAVRNLTNLRFRLGATLTFAAALPACIGSPGSEPEAVDAEAMVLATVLDSLLARGDVRQLIVARQTYAAASNATGLENDIRRRLGMAYPVDPQTVHGFVAANRTQQDLPPIASTKVPVRIAPDSTLEALRATPSQHGEPPFYSYWEAFYERFPGSAGISRLSRAGFNADSTQALVRIDTSCGSLCGSTDYVVVEKAVDRWHIAHVYNISVSSVHNGRRGSLAVRASGNFPDRTRTVRLMDSHDIEE